MLPLSSATAAAMPLAVPNMRRQRHGQSAAPSVSGSKRQTCSNPRSFRRSTVKVFHHHTKPQVYKNGSLFKQYKNDRAKANSVFIYRRRTDAKAVREIQ